VRRIALIATVVVTAVVASASLARAAASSESRLIQASPSFQRVGGYWVSDDPSYNGALKALGASTSCHLVRGYSSNVVANWAPLGLRMNLVTFGGIPSRKTGCTAPEAIQVNTIRVTGKSWHTSLKLSVGSSVSYLRSHYPQASPTKGVPGWYGAGYWLVTRRTACLGECGGVRTVTAPILVAETRGGRVSALVLVIGAQGE
jgi:hypothetical protein